MRNFLAKHKISISILVYLAVVVALFYFVAGKLFQSIEINNNLIQQIIIDQDNRKKRLGETGKLEEQYNMAVSYENLLGNLLTEDKAVKLIEDLEKIADDTGNKISIEVQGSGKEMEISKKAEKGEEKKEGILADIPQSEYIELDIKIAGSFENFLKFIKKIESMSYYNDVVSIDIGIIDKKQDRFMDDRASITTQLEPAALQKEKETPTPSNPEFLLDSTIVVLFYLQK
jgi:hypothetical protein